ncbi:MAG TPA: hypothetical protein VFZ27_11065 [Terriglobia bacterium]|nr:hypothetical protein [Terriglobia bacterium]
MGQTDTENVLEKLTYDYYHDYLLKGKPRNEAINLIARCNVVAADRDNDEIRFEALMMVLQLAEDMPSEDSMRIWCHATDRLIAGYINSPNICRVFEDYSILSPGLRLKADQYMEHVIENTESAAAVAGCHYAKLSEFLVREQYGGGLTSEERISTIEKLCALRESYGRELNPNPRLHFGLTFAEVAESDIFELENLRVGAIAPDIDGEDAEGVRFRLSDYTGNVVLLKFWGDW